MKLLAVRYSGCGGAVASSARSGSKLRYGRPDSLVANKFEINVHFVSAAMGERLDF